MKLLVKAKPSAHTSKVEKLDEQHYVVWVTEPPANGLANKGVVRALAEYFGVAPSRVQIRKGFTTQQKIIEII